MSESSISDHIGRIGESWFDLLANKAKLLAGRIEPDRLGRDRIVEFPSSERVETEPFDMRRAPLGCSIQIKSILATNDRVALTLSVAERLAGDNRPTFICILRVEEGSDEVLDMHLVHLLDGNLSRILKRLRQEFAEGTKALNKPEISFGIAAGRKVELTPDGLKTALRELIGKDMNAYGAEKLRQRETAGFKDSERYSMSVTFEEMTTSHLIDGMLGLKQLGVKDLQGFEERFKIKLPGGLPFPKGAENVVMQICPTPVDAGIISISSPTRNRTVELNCDLITPALPTIPVESMKVIARTKLLDAVVSVEDGAIKLTNTFDELSAHDVDEWWKLFSFWDAVFTHDAKLSLLSNAGHHLFSGSPGSAEMMEERPAYLDQVVAVLGMARQLLDESRSLNRLVSLRDVMLSAKSIQQTHSFFFNAGELGAFSFPIEITDQVEEGEYAGLYVSVLRLGDDVYAYALKLALVLDEVSGEFVFRSTSMTPLDISWIENDEAALQTYAKRIAKLSGSQITILPVFSVPDEASVPSVDQE
ncbi:hypothetical protein [Rhizobium sp. PP-CC-3G-465]|uniref:hypothetical protein n=1 Tax=Rhizobium sp. PP-CC-3G-465 TaxID=2135648 RepID=UPI00104E109C|nr:hypothetical protein C8J33_12413 [Rhizobium sp. PP-CC-3G-465]